MTIHIDKQFRCHAEPNEETEPYECEFFDGRPGAIEGNRCIPKGRQWTREDGVVFEGEMIAPIGEEP